MAGTGGCDAGSTKIIGSHNTAAACPAAPTPPPAGLALDPFYAKYLDAGGIPVLASAAVQDLAVQLACAVVLNVIGPRDDLRQAMVTLSMRVAVIGRDQVTTDMPEHSDLNDVFPNTDWDALRGLGSTRVRPLSSWGEENLLCLPGDRFAGELALVQTFSTGFLLAISDIDTTSPSFETRLRAAYDSARSAGLWRDTFAEDNVIAYYSEGVQSWFDVNGQASPPDGTHNEINTRAALIAYDPALAALIAESLHDDTRWRPRCP